MTIGKGLGFIKEASKNSVSFLKVKSGEYAVIRFLVPTDELISVYEHTEQFNGSWKSVTCLGKNDCPICQAGKYPSFVTYIPVLDRTDNDRVKIFKASKKVGIQLLSLVEEYGDLTRRDFKLYRQGEKQQTTYQFFPRDPQELDLSQYEVPDIEAMVQPLSREAIIALMSGGVSDAPSGGAGRGDSTISNDDDFPF